MMPRINEMLADTYLAQKVAPKKKPLNPIVIKIQIPTAFALSKYEWPK